MQGSVVISCLYMLILLGLGNSYVKKSPIINLKRFRTFQYLSSATAANVGDSKKKIVFLGTPDVAAMSLELLCKGCDSHMYDIVAVVTQPPAPAGRQRKLTPSAVQIYAESQKLRVFTPEKAGDAAFIETLKSLTPDLCITAGCSCYLYI